MPASRLRGAYFTPCNIAWYRDSAIRRLSWAMAHRLCRLAWIILHNGVEYIEYGKQRDSKAGDRRSAKLIRALRGLGCQVIPAPAKVVRP